MPLLVGGSGTPAVYAPGTGTGIGSPAWWVTKQTPGTINATWIDPDGTFWPLTQPWQDSGPGWFTMDGPAAWGSTPIELVTDPYPRGGEVVRYIRAKPRRIQWPLYVGGDSHLEFVRRYRDIMRAFTKTTYRRAPGILEIKRPDASVRRIQGFYEQGFEGEAAENWLWAKPVIQLFCPDGYWYDPSPVGVVREARILEPADEHRSYYDPFLNLGSAPVFDDSDSTSGIVNPGDVDGWPIWEITGPIDGFQATNTTTGLRFKFDYDIPAGVVVTITTNPCTVRDSTGLNLSRHIDWFNEAGTSLWPFAPGRNTLLLEPLTPQAGSKIKVDFLPRYESA